MRTLKSGETGVRGRGATVAGAVEGVANDVADKGGAEDLGCVGAGIDDVDEGIGGDQQAEERGAETRQGRPADPAGQFRAEGPGSDERDSEHGEVGDLVVGDGGVLEDMEGLLRVDADVPEDEQKQNERAGEDRGVDGSAIAWVEAGEPGGDEVRPSRRSWGGG